jgi:hypothetical protein
MNPQPRKTDNTDPLLLPPREEPYILTDVLEKQVHGCRDELILNMRDSFLRFVVDNETDTMMSLFQPSPFRATKDFTSIQGAAPWKQYIGKECGWTWIGWNQQGYVDMMLISFDGIEPNVLLQTIASSIKVFTIAPVEDTSASSRSRESKTKARGKQ